MLLQGRVTDVCMYITVPVVYLLCENAVYIKLTMYWKLVTGTHTYGMYVLGVQVCMYILLRNTPYLYSGT